MSAELVGKWLAAKRSLEELQKKCDELREEIINTVFNKTPGSKSFDELGVVLVLEQVESKRFDSTQFKKDFPNLYERFLKTTSYMRLSHSELKDER